jgi:integrase
MAVSKHPGIWILSPTASHGYRLKYRCPDKEALVKKPFEGAKFQATTQAGARAREEAAVRKYNEILRRGFALEDGALRQRKVKLEEAEQLYMDTLKSPRTVETYREGTRVFLAWAATKGIRTTDDVTRGRLVEFHAHLSTFDVAPATFDKRLRAVKSMVSQWIDAMFCARITYDDLKRLKLKGEPVEDRVWLTPTQCQKMLEAAMRHDRELAGKWRPIAPYVMYVLLGGARVSEALALDWSHIDLGALNVNSELVGEITVPASVSKTKKRRVIGLQESPSLRRLFAALQLRSGDKAGPVWDLTRMAAKRSRCRMSEEFGSPQFSYQQLRVTCDCYLNNSPGIYGGAAAFMAAQRLGHSVAISEKFYASAIRGIKPELHTLEEVLGITKQCDQIITAIAMPSDHDASVSRIVASK